MYTVGTYQSKEYDHRKQQPIVASAAEAAIGNKALATTGIAWQAY